MHSRRDKYVFDKHKFKKYNSPEELMRVDEFAVLYSESLTTESAKAIREELSQNNIFAFIIDEERKISNKRELLNAIEQAADFPEWGRNWDALADWLGSFHWREADGYVMIYMNPQKLIESHKEDYDMLLDVVLVESARWRVDGVPFKLLTTAPPGDEQ